MSRRYLLWASPVWEIPAAKEFQTELSSLAKRITNYKSLANQEANKSLRSGWRIDDPHTLDGLEMIDSYITWLCEQCFKDAKKEPNRERLRLTSWLNVHESGGYNTVHNHPYSLISGVIYIQCPKGSGSLHLRDPRTGAAGDTLLEDICKDLVIKPENGKSILFPGYLEHWVEPSQTDSNENRISIAFNVHDF